MSIEIRKTPAVLQFKAEILFVKKVLTLLKLKKIIHEILIKIAIGRENRKWIKIQETNEKIINLIQN